MIDLDGKAQGGVRFMLKSSNTLMRCRSEREIEAQARLLHAMIDQVAAKMKIELDRQIVERQL